MPWRRWMVAVRATFWGGWYLDHTGGPFDTTTHVAYGRGGERDPTVAETAEDQGQTGVANPVERGRQVYTQNCRACPQSDGRGLLMYGGPRPCAARQAEWRLFRILGADGVLIPSDSFILDDAHLDGDCDSLGVVADDTTGP